MKTVLDDGRVFETMPFIKIEYNPDEPVYKYFFVTADRTVKSSARHVWAVWDTQNRDVALTRMDAIDVDRHELLVQGWQ